MCDVELRSPRATLIGRPAHARGRPGARAGAGAARRKVAHRGRRGSGVTPAGATRRLRRRQPDCRPRKPPGVYTAERSEGPHATPMLNCRCSTPSARREGGGHPPEHLRHRHLVGDVRAPVSPAARGHRRTAAHLGSRRQHRTHHGRLRGPLSARSGDRRGARRRECRARPPQPRALGRPLSRRACRGVDRGR
jgi:hypothetical protein